MQCFLLLPDLQIPKHCQVEVWICILSLVTTDGILLALVSTVKKKNKTAHRGSETQELRGEKALT